MTISKLLMFISVLEELDKVRRESEQRIKDLSNQHRLRSQVGSCNNIDIMNCTGLWFCFVVVAFTVFFIN